VLGSMPPVRVLSELADDEDGGDMDEVWSRLGVVNDRKDGGLEL
jgi:hypothetical protein